VLAKRQGARLIILNREESDLEDVADVLPNLEIGRTLGEEVGVE